MAEVTYRTVTESSNACCTAEWHHEQRRCNAVLREMQQQRFAAVSSARVMPWQNANDE